MRTDRLPFSGIRVIDVTRVLAGPYTTYQLALLGAEVIKVEDPIAFGDFSRHKVGAERSPQAMATNFLSTNANKKSLTLNLRTPEGQRIFKKLAVDADVLVENLRAGSMARYGLEYEAIHALNPKIIYCSITGYGATGPKRRHPAYDPVIQAASGMMSITGDERGPPTKNGASVVDYGAGLAAAFAITAALLQREKGGPGRYIDVSMLDIALAMMGNVVAETLMSGIDPKRWGNTCGPSSPLNACFNTMGESIWITAAEEHQVEAFWRAIKREDIPKDPRFQTGASRSANFRELQDEIAQTLMTKSAQEWEDILNEAGVPAMRIRSITQALHHPQIATRGFLRTLDNIPGVDHAIVPTVPFLLSDVCVTVDSPPLLGQQTETILRELGYSTSEVAQLREEGIV